MFLTGCEHCLCDKCGKRCKLCETCVYEEIPHIECEGFEEVKKTMTLGAAIKRVIKSSIDTICNWTGLTASEVGGALDQMERLNDWEMSDVPIGICDGCLCWDCIYDCDYCVKREHGCGEEVKCKRYRRRSR